MVLNRSFFNPNPKARNKLGKSRKKIGIILYNLLMC